MNLFSSCFINHIQKEPILGEIKENGKIYQAYEGIFSIIALPDHNMKFSENNIFDSLDDEVYQLIIQDFYNITILLEIYRKSHLLIDCQFEFDRRLDAHIQKS